MLNFKKTLALVLLFCSASLVAQEYTVRLEISEIATKDGKLRIGLFDDAENFKNKQHPAFSKSVAIAGVTTQAEIGSIPHGKYAIAVYHDQNNDFQLNTKKLGIPSEGVGFSGNSNSKLKPPDFEMASFELKQDTLVTIHLKYPK